MFDKVLGALSGHPQRYSVDPNTGKETGTPETDRGTLARHIVAAALVGLFKGAEQRGPGSLGRAAAAGGEAGANLAEQQDAKARQIPLDNYDREQLAQVRQHQMAQLGMDTAIKGYEFSKLGGEAVARQIASDSLAVSAAEKATGKPLDEISPQQMIDDFHNGKLKIGDLGTTYLRKTPVTFSYKPNETAEEREVEGSTWVKADPNQVVKIAPEAIDYLKQNGMPVAKSLQPGMELPLRAVVYHLKNAQGIDYGQSLADLIHGDKAPDIGALSRNNAGIAPAMNAFIGYKSQAKSLSEAIQTMRQTNPAQAALVEQTLGGPTAIEDYERQHNAELEQAGKSEAEVAADPEKQPPNRLQVATFTQKTVAGYSHVEPAERNALVAQASGARTQKQFEDVQTRALQLERNGVDKYIAETNARAAKQQAKENALAVKGTDSINRVFTDPQHGFGQTLAQATVGKSSIRAGMDGSGLATSLAPTMEVLGLNSFAGTHRIPPAEAQAAGAPGGWSERFNAWFTKSTSGKITPRLAAEGNQLFDELIASKHSQSIQASRIIAANAGLDAGSITVADRRGNPDTLAHQIQVLTPPHGATMKVLGSDGKWHWSDGRTDLGAAE